MSPGPASVTTMATSQLACKPFTDKQCSAVQRSHAMALLMQIEAFASTRPRALFIQSGDCVTANTSATPRPPAPPHYAPPHICLRAPAYSHNLSSQHNYSHPLQVRMASVVPRLSFTVILLTIIALFAGQTTAFVPASKGALLSADSMLTGTAT
jgi:hypothetical protein